MSSIEWKDIYCLGNDEIDFEHKIFVKIIQKIDKAVTERCSMQTLSRLLLELKKYADFHFQSEENFMMEIDYPDIVAHKSEHEKLLSQLQLTILRVEIGDLKPDVIADFLIEWFKNHTIIVDKKLVEFID